MSTDTPRLPPRWALALWMGAAFALRLADLLVKGSVGGARPSPALAALGALPTALVSGVFLWSAFRLAGRAPLRRGPGLLRALLAHLGAALLLASCATALIRAVDRLFGVADDPHPVAQGVTRVIGYVLVAGVAHALLYARGVREKEAEELRLRAALAEAGAQHARAELQVLRMELNPHFLFNALHTVSGLMYEDVRRAGEVLARVGDLLRRAVARVGAHEVALGEEVEFLRSYLAIEQGRMQDGLRVEWEVDREALDAGVPHLILQPLVENALKHGIAPRGAGCLRVGARRQGGRLRLWVEDDGVGVDEGAGARVRVHRGVGVGNVRARLAQHYGHEQRFGIVPAAGGGTRAEIEIPFHPPASAVPAAAPWREADAAPAASAPPPAGGGEERPAQKPAPRRRWRSRVGYGVLFAALWLLFTDVSRTDVLADGSTLAPALAVVVGLYSALMWCAYVGLAFRVSRRWPLEPGRWLRHAGVHLAAAVAIGVCTWGVKVTARVVLGYARAESLAADLAMVVAGHLVMYSLLAALAHAVGLARRFRQKELGELRLRAELSEAGLRRARAELQVLKMELDPRFLLDALQTVSTLMHHDVGRANHVLVRLGDLLRGALDRVGAHEVMLEEELRFLRTYLEIERCRPGAALRVEWEVDEEALDAGVPHLIFQPLVENAIRHGLAPRGGGGCVRVGARCDDTELRLWVEDDGAGLPGAARLSGGGGGTGNVRARLEQLYGAGHGFTLAPAAGGGARAEIRIPLHHPAPRRDPWSLSSDAAHA